MHSETALATKSLQLAILFAIMQKLSYLCSVNKSTMEITTLLEFTHRDQLRNWLLEHGEDEQENGNGCHDGSFAQVSFLFGCLNNKRGLTSAPDGDNEYRHGGKQDQI